MYIMLPETENCSLEEIERHFANTNRKWTDTKIRKNSECNPPMTTYDLYEMDAGTARDRRPCHNRAYENDQNKF